MAGRSCSTPSTTTSTCSLKNARWFSIVGICGIGVGYTHAMSSTTRHPVPDREVAGDALVRASGGASRGPQQLESDVELGDVVPGRQAGLEQQERVGRVGDGLAVDADLDMARRPQRVDPLVRIASVDVRPLRPPRTSCRPCPSRTRRSRTGPACPRAAPGSPTPHCRSAGRRPRSTSTPRRPCAGSGSSGRCVRADRSGRPLSGSSRRAGGRSRRGRSTESCRRSRHRRRTRAAGDGSARGAPACRSGRVVDVVSDGLQVGDGHDALLLSSCVEKRVDRAEQRRSASRRSGHQAVPPIVDALTCRATAARIERTIGSTRWSVSAVTTAIGIGQLGEMLDRRTTRQPSSGDVAELISPFEPAVFVRRPSSPPRGGARNGGSRRGASAGERGVQPRRRRRSPASSTNGWMPLATGAAVDDEQAPGSTPVA